MYKYMMYLSGAVIQNWVIVLRLFVYIFSFLIFFEKIYYFFHKWSKTAKLDVQLIDFFVLK